MRSQGFFETMDLLQNIFQREEKGEERFCRCLLAAKRFDNPENRRWLRYEPVDSYGEESNRAEFFILEGSPPRGFIITSSNQSVYRYDGQGKRIKTWSVHDFE